MHPTPPTVLRGAGGKKTKKATSAPSTPAVVVAPPRVKTPLTAKDAADLVDDALLEDGLVKHAVDSFDMFVDGGELSAMFEAFSHRLSVTRDFNKQTKRQQQQQQLYNAIHNKEKKQSEDDITGCECVVGELLLGKPCIVESDGERVVSIPNRTRLRQLTYAVEMYTTVKRTMRYKKGPGPSVNLTQRIGWLPIPVGSRRCHMRDLSDEEKMRLGECPVDPGGSFGTNGSERALIPNEKRACNIIFVNHAKANSRFSLVGDISSQTPESGKAATSMEIHLRAAMGAPPEIMAKMTYCDTLLNAFIVMTAFGVDSEEAMFAHVLFHLQNEGDDADALRSFLRPAIAEARVRAPTVEAARAIVGTAAAPSGASGPWVSAARRDTWTVERFLAHEVYPHIGITLGSDDDKACFLGMHIYRVVAVHFGWRNVDDRDHYARKLIESAGFEIKSIVRQLLKQFFKSTRSYMQKMVDRGTEPELTSTFREDAISRGIAQCINTGNWQVGKMSSHVTQKTGVAQPLNRLNYASTISNLRRSNTPMMRDGKVSTPRMLRNSHIGKLCPSETPEGKQCGLVRNHAMLLHISLGLDPCLRSPIKKLLNAVGDGLISASEAIRCGATAMEGAFKVFIDGAWVGVHRSPHEAAGRLRLLRRQHDLPAELGVALDVKENEIRINMGYGRAMRPLFVVEPGKSAPTLDHETLHALGPRPRWHKALALPGMIDLIDPDEEDTVMIAIGVRDLAFRGPSLFFSHSELDPVVQLGVVAAAIPALVHNQAPRNSYQCAMSKQAFGEATTNPKTRMDTNRQKLQYRQRPLVTTRTARASGQDTLPSGQNMCMAMLAGHYNIEDSFIVNQGAIDRGMGRTIIYRGFSDTEGSHGTAQEETHERPRRATLRGPSPGNTAMIDEDGLPPPGVYLQEDDIIIGKTLTVGHDDTESRNHPMGASKIDKSFVAREMDAGIVDKTIITTGTDPAGHKTAKTQLRKVRIPQIGDKFASRHGQKGTCGAIWPSEDMPFTADGIIPDILINPHAFPSRMTSGQLFESASAVLGALTGQHIDFSAFKDWDPAKHHGHEAWNTVDEMQRDLKANACSPNGATAMYSGRTGEKMEADVCFGIVFMQRLKHMVADKHNARDRGPTQILTHQPVEGRGKNGGQRFGEMERDCFIGHGVANLLRDRTFFSSDFSTMPVCKKCGLPAIAPVNDPRGEMRRCNACNLRGPENIKIVHLPYGSNLLFKENMSMGVAPRIGMDANCPPVPAIGTLPPPNAPSAIHNCYDISENMCTA